MKYIPISFEEAMTHIGSHHGGDDVAIFWRYYANEEWNDGAPIHKTLGNLRDMMWAKAFEPFIYKCVCPDNVTIISVPPELRGKTFKVRMEELP